MHIIITCLHSFFCKPNGIHLCIVFLFLHINLFSIFDSYLKLHCRMNLLLSHFAFPLSIHMPEDMGAFCTYFSKKLRSSRQSKQWRMELFYGNTRGKTGRINRIMFKPLWKTCDLLRPIKTRLVQHFIFFPLLSHCFNNPCFKNMRQ